MLVSYPLGEPESACMLKESVYVAHPDNWINVNVVSGIFK